MRYPSIALAGALCVLTSCGNVATTEVITPTATPVITTSTPVPTTSPLATPDPTPTPSAEVDTKETISNVTTILPQWQSLFSDYNSDILHSAPLEFVVTSVAIADNCITVDFIPNAGGENLSNFINEPHRNPNMQITYDPDHAALHIQFDNTLLVSSNPELDGGDSDDWVFDYIDEMGYTYPSTFPTGLIDSTSTIFSNTGIYTDGTHTYITTILSDGTSEYFVESGFRDANNGHPYFHIQFDY